MDSHKNGNIEPTNLTTEMRDSYIDYAMSVIIGRALPDVRDGMKPVHRRILYAMNELGLTPDRQFRKSVRIVGDVLGKFHPHGDTSVYDALTRMAQDFTMRYPTVLGHGNFGSIDGDAPAAMRYTEAKMDYISKEMLRDINKDTVDFIENFDGSEMEPTVLTARFPHLLVNGSQGIAVGMATNIPPHNLGEVIDATVAYIKNPDIKLKDLMKKLPGPDFPTGGAIHGREGIVKAYETGNGKIKVRGKAKVEEGKRGKHEIVITELPYMVNKAKLIEKIAQLHHQKKLEGITEVRDESDLKQGIRVVVDLKKGIDPNYILNQLYKYTDLENTFGIINLALVPDDEGNLHPKVLTIKEILKEYVDHQRDIITRRTKFDLKKAEARAHILEGLLIALDNIDEVIEIIRSSRSAKSASAKLMKRFSLSEQQAQAVLDMRLQRLVGLERSKLKKEFKELKKQIAYYKKLLSDEKEIDKVVIKELEEIKDNYSDERRTEIIDEDDEVEEAFVVPEKELKVYYTDQNYLNSTGRNRTVKLQGNDVVRHEFDLTNYDSLIFISDKGKAYRMAGTDFPEVRGRGKHIKSIFTMDDDENIINVIPVSDFKGKEKLFLATSNGMVKKLNLDELDSNVKKGISIMNLKTHDNRLIGAELLDDDNGEIILVTNEGLGIKFDASEVNPTRRGAAGVKGINLSKTDRVIDLIGDKEVIVTVSEDGFVKGFRTGSLNKQKRAGKGLRISPKDQKLDFAISLNKPDEEFYVNTGEKIEKTKLAKLNKRTDRGTKLFDGNITEVFS